MNWTRLSSILAFVLLYVAGVGGFEAIAQGDGFFEAMRAPFGRVHPYDGAAIILAVGFAAALWIPTDRLAPLESSVLWRGLAYGCAITTAALYAMVVSGIASSAPMLVGAIVVTAVAESVVGLIAVGFLFANRTSFSSTVVPAGMHIVLGGFGVALLGGWI